MVTFKGRWNGNQVSIRFNGRGTGAQEAALHRLFHHAVKIGLDNMNLATVNGFHRTGVDIHTDNLFLTRGKRRRGGQANVAKTNDREGSKTHNDT